MAGVLLTPAASKAMGDHGGIPSLMDFHNTQTAALHGLRLDTQFADTEDYSSSTPKRNCQCAIHACCQNGLYPDSEGARTLTGCSLPAGSSQHIHSYKPPCFSQHAPDMVRTLSTPAAGMYWARGSGFKVTCIGISNHTCCKGSIGPGGGGARTPTGG